MDRQRGAALARVAGNSPAPPASNRVTHVRPRAGQARLPPWCKEGSDVPDPGNALPEMNQDPAAVGRIGLHADVELLNVLLIQKGQYPPFQLA